VESIGQRGDGPILDAVFTRPGQSARDWQLHLFIDPRQAGLASNGQQDGDHLTLVLGVVMDLVDAADHAVDAGGDARGIIRLYVVHPPTQRPITHVLVVVDVLAPLTPKHRPIIDFACSKQLM